MITKNLAERLLARAVADEQVAYAIRDADDVPLLRREIRRLGRDQKVSIRTAIIDGALAVVRTDAAIWTDSTATMRAKLAPDREL